MSSLSTRLARLRVEDVGLSTLPSPSTDRIDRLRLLIAQTIARSPKREERVRGEQPPLPGALRDGLHVVERWHEPRHAHGRVAIAPACDVPPATLAALALDPTLIDVDARRALYLDTETTGLAGGTGTIPFLVGLARFVDDSLLVEQLFLRQPGEEAPMLRALAERLADASCLVTYNGKSFDWPLLRTRFVLARVPCPTLPPHVDLLHCARRVLKRRMAAHGVGVRLVEVERLVLGLYREDDIAGSEVPAAYLDWLRHGATERLCAVLEHNASDLVALPATLVALADRWGVRAEDDTVEHLSLTELAWRARDWERAKRFAHLAAEGAADAEQKNRGEWWVARVEKRLKREARRAIREGTQERRADPRTP